MLRSSNVECRTLFGSIGRCSERRMKIGTKFIHCSKLYPDCTDGNSTHSRNHIDKQVARVNSHGHFSAPQQSKLNMLVSLLLYKCLRISKEMDARKEISQKQIGASSLTDFIAINVRKNKCRFSTLLSSYKFCAVNTQLLKFSVGGFGKSFSKMANFRSDVCYLFISFIVRATKSPKSCKQIGIYSQSRLTEIV